MMSKQSSDRSNTHSHLFFFCFFFVLGVLVEFLPDYRTLTVIVSSWKDARMQKRLLGVFRSAVQLN